MGSAAHPPTVLDSRSPVPLYHQLAEELFAAIQSGAFAPGTRIPSEHELASRYRIGRPTVRQATDTLIHRGVLERRRGSGTFVRHAPAEVDLFSLAGTLVSFERGGIAVSTELLGPTRRERVDDPAHPFAGSEVFRVVRRSFASDTPILLEELDFDAVRFPGLDAIDLAGRSISELIAERYRARAVRADQSFRVEHLDRQRAGLLALRTGVAVLRVERLLHFTRHGAAVFARMYCPSGPFVFSQSIGGT